jgi:hypothetical protein
MDTQPTAEEAKQSLNDHVAYKGWEICQRFGPGLGWADLQVLLNDRAFVRYPVEIVFDTANLNPGEFAYPAQRGERPEEGFIMYVHPIYMVQLSMVPYLVLYQLVSVNYGQFASPDDAETFGAHALGISRDEYYATVCELADQLGVGFDPGTSMLSGCGGGCS